MGLRLLHDKVLRGARHCPRQLQDGESRFPRWLQLTILDNGALRTNAIPDGYRWICLWNSLSMPSANRTKAGRKLYSLRQDAPRATRQISRAALSWAKWKRRWKWCSYAFSWHLERAVDALCSHVRDSVHTTTVFFRREMVHDARYESLFRCHPVLETWSSRSH